MKKSQLFGTLPPSYFMEAENLALLDLVQNGISGKIPTEIGIAANLEIFDMTLNGLTGSVPTDVGLCTSLRRFFVARNDLQGSIPVEQFLSLPHLGTTSIFVSVTRTAAHLTTCSWPHHRGCVLRGKPCGWGYDTTLRTRACVC